MAQPRTIKPTDKALKAYYATLQGFSDQHVTHEGAVETAFQRLLTDTAKSHGWMLIPKLTVKRGGKHVIPDGTVRDDYFHRGYWEAKDTDDDLDAEISKKAAKGYPLKNTIFEDTRRAVLFQNGEESFRADLTSPRELADLLTAFYSYTEPDIQGFVQAVDEFQERVPDLGRALAEKITQAHADNPRFQKAFDDFFKLCQTALNPNIRQQAVDEMLVQHLLTERLIRKIFDNPEFTQRNVIAAEVEKVIAALVSKSFNRDEFLKSLDRFYTAIENAARSLEDFKEKQELLNTVYERFFQGFSVKVADTHGIIYTPQPIVDFMCASVAEVLDTEFGLSLGSPGVHILDPCTGTGNFIVNLLGRIPKRDLPRMYREQLFANEVMLMPYYIAALNIEHAYYELTGQYEPFDGLCFVDTLDMAEGSQRLLSYMTEANTIRVERQKKTPITVIIGNPPYNAWQLNENDNNKNRAYEIIENRIKDTYAKDSKATNKNSLSDAYVKFFRWAADRIPKDGNGIVCFVSNNGFLDGVAFDGFRKHMIEGFDLVYHFDLKGNARTSGERRRREGGNIFSDMIRVGIGITVLVRKVRRSPAKVLYHVVPDYWKAEQKKQHLATFAAVSEVPWQALAPDVRGRWLAGGHADEFNRFVSIGNDETRASRPGANAAVFKSYCRGLETTRDDWVYDFDRRPLVEKVGRFIETYNSEIDRWKRAKRPKDVDSFVVSDDHAIKWSSRLKETFVRETYAEFDASKIRTAVYRPFSKRLVFFDSVLNHRTGIFAEVFPTARSEHENQVIAVTDLGSEKPFMALVTNSIADLHLVGAASATQCFPFYVYASDGSDRRENITDWALGRFREHYGDGSITKWDIFYYVYGLLHHPGYRERFADNLKRELPRIPFAPSPPTPLPQSGARGEKSVARPESAKGVAKGRRKAATPIEDSGRATPAKDSGRATPNAPLAPSAGRGAGGEGFWAFATAGKQLAELHLNYEQLEPFPLQFIVSPEFPLSYRVESKMRLSRDKSSVAVNESLLLAGIPPETFDYRLGNRSALEWVIDQYQVTTDKRSGIHSDPNRPDDEEYIVRLIGQVTRVSMETVRLVAALPERFSD